LSYVRVLQIMGQTHALHGRAVTDTCACDTFTIQCIGQVIYGV
jgi:hypothetical protein